MSTLSTLMAFDCNLDTAISKLFGIQLIKLYVVNVFQTDLYGSFK